MKQLITVDELSQILNVPKSWIYERTRQGQAAIPFVKLGAYVRFDPEEVIQFFKSHRNQVSCRPMKSTLTTYEAATKYKLTTGYIRRIMAQDRGIVGRLAKISKSGSMWLIDAQSLQSYMRKRSKPGRPKKQLLIYVSLYDTIISRLRGAKSWAFSKRMVITGSIIM